MVNSKEIVTLYGKTQYLSIFLQHLIYEYGPMKLKAIMCSIVMLYHNPRYVMKTPYHVDCLLSHASSMKMSRFSLV